MGGLSSHPALDDLRAFVLVAEAAGFRRASRTVGVKQSVLSRRISNLEDALGASLFERTREGVRLTYAGSRFLREVRTIFTQLDSAVRSVRAAGTATLGCIRIGTVASISGGFMGRLLRDWRRAHPDVMVEFEAGFPQENLARVAHREIDVAIMTGTPSVADLESEALWMESVFAVLPGDHSLAHRTSVQLEELQGELFIVMRHPPGPEIYDWIIRRLSSLGSSPSIREQAVGRETLLSLVGLGFGVTLASSAETGIRHPNVCFVQIESEQLPFSAVWSPANDNPALRRFLSEARALSRRWTAAPLRTPDPSP